MRKIAIDLSAAQPQRLTKVNGGGEYGAYLFSLLSKDESIALEVFLDTKKGENNLVNTICRQKNIVQHYFANNEELSGLISDGQYDTVFFPICHPSYAGITVDKKQRIVAGIHDLSTIEQAEVIRKVYGKKYFADDGKDWVRRIYRCVNTVGEKKRAIKAHEKILHLSDRQITYTVSYSTKAEILYYFQEFTSDQIPVFYTPETVVFEEKRVDEQEVLSKYGVKSGEYFLCCSANRWNKNNAFAIKVMDSFLSNNEQLHYRAVVLGAVGKAGDYLKTLPRNKGGFTFTGYVDRIDMDILFKNAHAFVYPSVIEGFGLPPIEAMRYGTVSLCSTATSITEICDDAAIYFDPYSASSLYKALLKSFDKEYIEIVKRHISRRYDEIQKKRQEDVLGILKLVKGN